MPFLNLAEFQVAAPHDVDAQVTCTDCLLYGNYLVATFSESISNLCANQAAHRYPAIPAMCLMPPLTCDLPQSCVHLSRGFFQKKFFYAGLHVNGGGMRDIC